MNGSEGSCGRRGGYSFEDFGDRPADAAKDRFGTKDDSRADVQLGEEGSKRVLAIYLSLLFSRVVSQIPPKIVLITPVEASGVKVASTGQE